MGWLASIAVGIITAIVATFASGFVASLAVDWYRISSFEGGAGFFVVFMALVGLLAGFVIGLVVSRVTAARANPGFVKALGVSCGVVAAILGVIAGTARLLADVPPEIDGEPLFLQIELRWPANGGPDPASLEGAAYTRLGTSNGSTVRREEDGPLFVNDAHAIDGRLVVPGAVSVFTSRGQRVLRLGVGETQFAAFAVPLPGHPSDEQRTWSDWLPHGRSGEAPPDQFSYRFRVIKVSEPVRTDALGPFAISTIAAYFYSTGESDRLAAHAEFLVRYKGQPVAGFDRAGAVAIVGTDKPTLLAQALNANAAGECSLISEDGDRAKVEAVGSCTAPITAHPLTSDAARFSAAKKLAPVPGWFDRDTFAVPGLYQIERTILDTRTLTVTRFSLGDEPTPIPNVPPLALSPDERSLVWFGIDGSEDRPMLGVTDFTTSQSYTLTIDRARMRYNTFDDLDPAWLAHHFEWRRGDGHDVLAERPSFVPLSYHGDLTLGRPGDYSAYTLRPGGAELRKLVVELLVTELGGERLPDELNGYQQRVRLDGRTLEIVVIEASSYVSVSTEYGKSDPEFLRGVAARLDKLLATGKYDNAFRAPVGNSPAQ